MSKRNLSLSEIEEISSPLKKTRLDIQNSYFRTEGEKVFFPNLGANITEGDVGSDPS
jgi:hypothetical protein